MEKVILFLEHIGAEPAKIHEVASHLAELNQISQQEADAVKAAFKVEEPEEEKEYNDFKERLDKKLGIEAE